MMAALSYMGILCFVPLLTNREDEYVHFHAKQGLVLWMWAVIAMFAGSFSAIFQDDIRVRYPGTVDRRADFHLASQGLEVAAGVAACRRYRIAGRWCFVMTDH